MQTALHPPSARVESARVSGGELADSPAQLVDIHQTLSVARDHQCPPLALGPRPDALRFAGPTGR